MITFQPLGGASEIGASCAILTIGDHRLLIDAGMRPDPRPGQSRTPDLAALAAQPPDALIITHAHTDHIGCVPLIAQQFPSIPIYATDSTLALMQLMLRDSARIMAQEALEPEGEVPLYDEALVEETIRRVTPLSSGMTIQPFAGDPSVTIQLIHAGHIMGAVMLLITTPWGRILHTGDVSVGDGRTIKGVDLTNVPQADIMICEGTYGDKTHLNRKEQERALAQHVQQIVGRGGRVLIPAFAIGRAQEVVLILKAFRASGQLSPVPIWIDGLVRAVATTYQDQVHALHPALQNHLRNAQRPLFADPSLDVFNVQSRQRDDLASDRRPAVIISTSGMLHGGPAPRYAQALATRERNAILFTGYQDEESPGARLLRTQQGDTITLQQQRVRLDCQVEKYSLSGHADAGQLQQLVTLAQPRTLVLVHGDPHVLAAFAQRFRKIEVIIPQNGMTVPLRRGPARAVVAAPAPLPTPTLDPATVELPTLAVLHALVVQHSPTPRAWTAVELGQLAVGDQYTPALRPRIEHLLVQPAPYFQVKKLGAQHVYTPRPHTDVQQRLAQPASTTARPSRRAALPHDVAPGEIVLVHGNNPVTAQLALVLTVPVGSHLDLVAERWKSTHHPLNVVGVRPGILRPALLTPDPTAIQAALVAWRARIDATPIDQIALWQAADGEPQQLADLLDTMPDDDTRLALALDLLQRGGVLWLRADDEWQPRPMETLGDTAAAITRHLALVAHGTRLVADDQGRQGQLTGRTGWMQVEVQWDATGRTEWVKDKRLHPCGEDTRP